MDRRTFIGSISGGLFTLQLDANAQSPPKIARVGYLNSSPRDATPSSTRPSTPDCGSWDLSKARTSSSIFGTRTRTIACGNVPPSSLARALR